MKHKHSLGQNFLTDTNVLAKIIETANLKGDETVVEVGGGDGFLTHELENQVKSQKSKVKSHGKILVLEFDYGLVEKLRGEFKHSKIVKIIHQDALKFDWENLSIGYEIVANLPYQITSPLLNLWTFQLKNQPESLTLMVQKEVAERLCAPPCSAKRGLMTIIVELYGEAKYIETVSAKAFSPIPKVNSAIINIKRRDLLGSGGDFLWAKEERKAIIRIAKMGFSAKRKTLSNSLSGSLGISKDEVSSILGAVDIDPNCRAETLNIGQWAALTEKIKNDSRFFGQ